MTGWCHPPDNIEFFLGTLFASTKENGGRPGLRRSLPAHSLSNRYAMLELPAVVRHIVMPIVYFVGTVGKYRKFKDAPAPIRRCT